MTFKKTWWCPSGKCGKKVKCTFARGKKNETNFRCDGCGKYFTSAQVKKYNGKK
jgi:formylmethanofuran dehydrogenase subunit E